MPLVPGYPPGFPGPLGEGFPLRQGIDTTPRITQVNPVSGPIAGGTSVTITGFNFRLNNDGSQPTVSFVGVNATGVTVVSSTSITCTTAAASAAGLGNVVVTINGQVGTLKNGFYYSAATVSAVSPAFGPVAGGTRVKITGFNFVSSGLTVTFGGVTATDITFIDSNTISCLTPAGSSGFVDVIVQGYTFRVGYQYTTLARGTATDFRRAQSKAITIREVLNNTPNTATFVIDGQSNVPRYGEMIQVVDPKDANRLLFAGN